MQNAPRGAFRVCRMLQGEHSEHSAKLSTFIKLPFVIKIFVLPIFEWPLKTCITVVYGADIKSVKCNLSPDMTLTFELDTAVKF